MIPRDTIDRVFSAAAIEEVVTDYVSLKRRGANLIGLCPFHDERTGSFTVSPSKGIYKCFGCGKAGNAINFIMEIEHCSYVDAIKILARKYHIEIEERELTREEQQRQDDRESMFVVNDAANRWFQDQLWNTQEGQAVGLSYFRQRGLQDKTIHDFQLGYCPAHGNQLAAYLKQKSFEERYISNNVDTKIGTGLCGVSDKGDLYDRFRDRVMFPIMSISGKTVAFAGRILKKKYDKDGKELPIGKYVNSPDSIIYSKTNELYGFFQAKQAIQKKDMCYLVEGQMDVLSMHQCGIENVVASGGTALTRPQIRLIHRFTQNITVLYDGDSAGIHAALKGIDMFLDEGFAVKVLLLPDGEDPDSFAQKHDASEFIEYIKAHQTDFIRFKTQLLADEAGTDPIKRSQLIRDIVQTISVIPDRITRQVYIQECARLLDMQEGVLTRSVADLRIERYKEREQQKKDTSSSSSEKTTTPAASGTTSPVTSVADTKERLTPFDQNILNLLQVIVRYGETLIQVDAENMAPVGVYIIQTLQSDQISPRIPLHQRIIDEYMAHYSETDFSAQKFFLHHPDTEISQLAVQLIEEKYQVSTIFSHQSVSENVKKDVEPTNGIDRVPLLTTRLLLEIKLTVVNEKIDATNRQLADPNISWSMTQELLQLLPQLNFLRSELCRCLGNRVINPS